MEKYPTLEKCCRKDVLFCKPFFLPGSQDDRMVRMVTRDFQALIEDAENNTAKSDSNKTNKSQKNPSVALMCAPLMSTDKNSLSDYHTSVLEV